MEFSEDEKKMSRKVLLQFYFIVFIFLNIIDFLNIIEGDTDFFKKLLSWGIIAYVFYSASFTEMMIGKRLKNYDLLFLLGFSLIGLTKSLILYARTIADFNDYPIFGSFLLYVKDIDPSLTIQTTFLLGSLFLIIGCAGVLSNHSVQSKSFIGSVNLREGYFSYLIQFFLFIFMSIFFGLIIFNFFMEWFALAVDSIILILGLIYYIFEYLNNHASTKFDSVLGSVSNTGNSFYQGVIKLFSDQKTIFVGISLLLTLHTLVDTGVYLVPYSLGTENTLYFSSLDTEERAHTPIFNFLTQEDSRLYQDVTSAPHLSVKAAVFLLHLDTLFLFFVLMAFPFFAYYKNIQKRHLNLPKVFVVIFLSSLCTWLFLIFSPGINPPIELGFPQSESIQGVDIYTNSLSENQDQEIFISSVLKILLFFIISTVFFWYVKNRWYIPLKKVMYATTLFFFLIYVGMYYISTVEVEAKKLQEDLKFSQSENREGSYESYYNLYVSDITTKTPRALNIKIDGSDINLRVHPFWTGSDDFHKDHIYFEFSNIRPDQKLFFNGIERMYFEDTEVYDEKKGTFSSTQTKGIFVIEEQIFGIEDGEFKTQELGSFLDSLLSVSSPANNSISRFERVIEYIRLIFLSVFYIFGLFAFTVFFIRKNIFIKPGDELP